MTNKNLGETSRQIVACCILHNFVQLAERELMDAAPLSRRSDDRQLAPTALLEDDELPGMEDDEDDEACVATLVEARDYRNDIMAECVAARRTQLAATFDERTVRAAHIRQALRNAERADRSS